MRSSSTERRGFLPGDAGAWARLALVAALGGAALLAPAVGATGAVYTDTETVGFEIGTATPAAATPAAPAALAAPAPIPGVPSTPTASATPSSSTAPQPTATPAPAPTQQTGPGGSRTPPWPVWPHHPGH